MKISATRTNEPGLRIGYPCMQSIVRFHLTIPEFEFPSFDVDRDKTVEVLLLKGPRSNRGGFPGVRLIVLPPSSS